MSAFRFGTPMANILRARHQLVQQVLGHHVLAFVHQLPQVPQFPLKFVTITLYCNSILQL